jgi:hypothetical protein
VNCSLCVSGYAPDPIAEWKKRASKLQGLSALEDDAPSEDDAEPEPEEKGKPLDPGDPFLHVSFSTNFFF